MREQDVMDMQTSAIEILRRKIGEMTAIEIADNPSAEAIKKAKIEQAELNALAFLGCSLVFGCLAEVVMMRQAMERQATAQEKALRIAEGYEG